MAVVGIDFGTLHSKVGVARHRGIDIITNEVSNRATPSLVAFGPKQRAIGESAKTQEISNFKNTIGSLKRLLGRTVNDRDVQDVEKGKGFVSGKLVDVSGTVGAEVNFRGEPVQFTSTQLVAMYLSKLRDIGSNELKTNVSDVVISVPGWYTDTQRRAMMDAAYIANLNVLRIINDTTAAALGYGITKSDLPDTQADDNLKPRIVVFVDIGHSTTSVSIVSFSKGQLAVRGSAFDRHLGGRDIDYVLVQHFAKEFNSKYGLDVLSNGKATFRLLAACEKLKKVLSANAEAPINVESIMNDVDASGKLTRDAFEGLITPLIDRLPKVVHDALEQADLRLDDGETIDSIELVGGSTRVPALRNAISSSFASLTGFNKPLRNTLNSDEAVARGATFACAMLSPVFKVRPFDYKDVNPYSIRFKWEVTKEEPDDSELEAFTKGNVISSTKNISFYRKEPFEIQIQYDEKEELPGSLSPWIGRVAVKQVPPPPPSADNKDKETTCVRVKTKLNANGVVGIEQVYVEELEEKEKEEPVPAATDPSAMDTSADAPNPSTTTDPNAPDGTAGGEAASSSAAAAADASPPPKKKKRVVTKRKVDIPYVTHFAQLDKSVLDRLKEEEGKLWSHDKLVMDTEDRKNALEEYVYDTRSKLDDRYAPFVQEQEKSTLLTALQQAEDWLYSEEGEDATKSAYVERLESLHKLGDPITFRWKEAEERSKHVAALRETLDQYESQATSSDDKYSHIDEKDKQSIVEKVANTRKWLEDMIVKQGERSKNIEPILKSEDLGKKRDEIIYFSTPILTKPKPKPPVTPQPGSGTQTPREEPKAKKEKKEEAPPADQGPSEMDVD